MTFIDFRKYFSSIHRGGMLLMLRAHDVPDRIVQAIGLMYNGTRDLTPDGNTYYFEIPAVVLQGDKLAPFLFTIVIDYATRQAIEGKSEKLGFKLNWERSRRQHPTVMTLLMTLP